MYNAWTCCIHFMNNPNQSQEIRAVLADTYACATMLEKSFVKGFTSLVFSRLGSTAIHTSFLTHDISDIYRCAMCIYVCRWCICAQAMRSRQRASKPPHLPHLSAREWLGNSDEALVEGGKIKRKRAAHKPAQKIEWIILCSVSWSGRTTRPPASPVHRFARATRESEYLPVSHGVANAEWFSWKMRNAAQHQI